MRHLVRAALQALLDGELPEQDLGRVEAHLKSCARCRENLDRLKNIHETIRSELKILRPDPIPAAGPFVPSVNRKTGIRRPLVDRLLLAPVRLPAIVVILMGMVCLIPAAMLLFQKEHDDLTQTPSSAGPGHYLTILLPQGTGSLPLDFPPDSFKPVQNPIIYKEIW